MNSSIEPAVLYILLSVIAVVILGYKYLTRNFHYWEVRGVPYLPPKVLFGNIQEVLSFKACFAQHLGNLYHVMKAPYFGIFIVDKPKLVLCDPDLIRTILIKDFNYFADRYNLSDTENDPVTAHMLLFSNNPEWKATRVKLTPIFTSGKLKGFVQLMEGAAENLIRFIEKQNLSKSIDTKKLCTKYSTDNIASCAFGIQAQCFEKDDSEFIRKGRLFFEFSYRNAIQQFMGFFVPEVAKALKFKITNPQLTRFFRDVFHYSMDLREKSRVKRNDLIDVLLDMQQNKKDGNSWQFESDSLVAQAGEFFLAGSETTSTTISFTMYEFSLNKTIQERAREEITSVKRQFGTWSYEALQSLKYLEMCINETLRKYPPMPFLDRKCLHDYRLPGHDLLIEKGIAVYIPLLGLHMDPKLFPEPEKYNPERHSPDNAHNIIKCSFLPFGDGSRSCLGARFGMLTTKMCLAKVLENYEVCKSKDTPVPIEFAAKSILLSSKAGVPLEFKKLNK